MKSLEQIVRNAVHASVIEAFLLTYKPDGQGGFEDQRGRKASPRSVQHFYASVAGSL